MKKYIVYVIGILFLCSCNRNENCDLTNIAIDSDIYEKLVYVDKIGKNFDSAVDSLICLKDLYGVDYSITVVKVIFDCDNRKFFGILFDDCGNYTDVLDSKGNYYLRTWTHD